MSEELIARLRRVPMIRCGVYVHPDGDIPVDGVLLHRVADEMERGREAMRMALHCMERMLRDGEWYAPEKAISALRRELGEDV